MLNKYYKKRKIELYKGNIANIQSEPLNIITLNNSFVIHCIRNILRQNLQGVKGDMLYMEQLICILCFLRDIKAIFTFLNGTLLFYSHQSCREDQYYFSGHKWVPFRWTVWVILWPKVKNELSCPNPGKHDLDIIMYLVTRHGVWIGN
jgi:hypothetical protein